MTKMVIKQASKQIKYRKWPPL